MNSTTTILFRADAGPGIGLGHLQRSLSLAGALKQQGVASRFLADTTSEGLKRADVCGFKMDLLGDMEPWSGEDVQRTCEIASLNECNSIVVDSIGGGSQLPGSPRPSDGSIKSGSFSMTRGGVSENFFMKCS